MRKKAFLPFLLFIFVVSCNNITKEKLTIIDNFVLGQSTVSISKQMDSLSIQHKRFCTKMVLSENELFDNNNFINMYYTNTFNLSNYRGRFNENLGLLFPITLTGTQNTMGLIVLLGHTAQHWFLGTSKNYENTYAEKSFYQDINADLIEDIKNLYISKYGQPTDTFSLPAHKFHFIKGNQILEDGDIDRKGLYIKWETEYYTITFFNGLPSYDSKFNTYEKSYQDQFYLGGSRFPKQVNRFKNEVKCYSYCYIKYELNAKAIKALKLDKKNI